jgi:hypothetical protein
MIALGLIAAFATIFMAGCGAVLLLTRDQPRRNVAEVLSLGAFLGSGIVSLLLWLGGFFVSGAMLQSAVAICCLAIAALGWRVLRRARPRFAWPKSTTTLECFLAALLIIEIAAIVWISLGQPLGWDGSFNWEIKARFAFLNGGTMPRAYYASPPQALTHPEYPLFIPFTLLWIDMWIGQAHQFWEKAVYSIWATAGIVLLCVYAARLSGRRWLGLLLGGFAPFVPYLMRGMGGITSGYADLPLGMLYCVAVASLVLYQRTLDPAHFCIYAAALTFLPWMKREGAILWAIAVIGGFVVVRQRRANVKLCLAFLSGSVVLIAWSGYLRSVGAAPSHDFVSVNAQMLAERWQRFGPIAITFVLELVRADHWSLFWILVGAAFVQQIFRRRDGTFSLLAFSLFAPTLVYSFTYLFSTWPDYLEHIRDSIPRLLLELVPIGWLMIATAFRLTSARSTSIRSTSTEPAPATLLPVR